MILSIESFQPFSDLMADLQYLNVSPFFNAASRF
jgi:hypothetical protein